MMNIEPSNPVIRLAMQSAMSGTESTFTCHDYENCKIQISTDVENNKILFSFSCNNYKEILQAGEEYFLQKWYSDYTKEQPVNGFDLTLSVDLSLIKELKKIPKNISEEEEEKLKLEKQQTKENNKKIIEKVSDDFSKFKRNFYGSPFERILTNMIEQKQNNNKVSYSIRKGERIWIVAENFDQVTIYFGLYFEDKVDKTICQMILDEMPESIRLVQNPPSVKMGKYPDALLPYFPDVQKLNLKYEKGVVSLTLFKNQHIVNAIEKATNYLQGFRQYVHYHVHASKSYLHSRILNRINYFYQEQQKAKFEKDEDKYYRTLKEDNLMVKGEIEQEDRLKTQILKQ